MTWRRRLRRWLQERRDRRQARLERRRLSGLGKCAQFQTTRPFLTDRSDQHAGE